MTFLDRHQFQILSILRIVTGLQFLEHGTAKMFHFPYVKMYDHVTLTSWPLGYAGALEVVLGILIILGLYSRIAAFIASGQMAIAYFTVFPHRSFFPMISTGDAAISFCFIFLFIAAAGPGPWAVNQK